MSYKKKSINTQIINKDTGEVTNNLIEIPITKVQIEPHIRQYSDTIIELAQKLSYRQFAVFMLISHFVTFDTNAFHINKELKAKMFQALDISDHTLMVIITELSKTGVILRTEKGHYLVDARYNFKGAEINRPNIVLNFTINNTNSFNTNNGEIVS
jgi:hypothetical protein